MRKVINESANPMKKDPWPRKYWKKEKKRKTGVKQITIYFKLIFASILGQEMSFFQKKKKNRAKKVLRTAVILAHIPTTEDSQERLKLGWTSLH